MELTNIGTVREILGKHGFSFSKGLGQNFIINPDICQKIAEYGNAKSGFGILEVGTGIGVLTKGLAKRADIQRLNGSTCVLMPDIIRGKRRILVFDNLIR